MSCTVTALGKSEEEGAGCHRGDVSPASPAEAPGAGASLPLPAAAEAGGAAPAPCAAPAGEGGRPSAAPGGSGAGGEGRREWGGVWDDSRVLELNTGRVHLPVHSMARCVQPQPNHPLRGLRLMQGWEQHFGAHQPRCAAPQSDPGLLGAAGSKLSSLHFGRAGDAQGAEEMPPWVPPCLLIPNPSCSALRVQGGSRAFPGALTWLQGQQFLYERLNGAGGRPGGAGSALIHVSPSNCSSRKGLLGPHGCSTA